MMGNSTSSWSNAQAPKAAATVATPVQVPTAPDTFSQLDEMQASLSALAPSVSPSWPHPSLLPPFQSQQTVCAVLNQIIALIKCDRIITPGC